MMVMPRWRHRLDQRPKLEHVAEPEGRAFKVKHPGVVTQGGDEIRRIAAVDEGRCDAEAFEMLLEELMGRGITIGYGDDVGAGRDAGVDRRADRPHAGREAAGPLSLFEPRQLALQERDGRIAPPRVVKIRALRQQAPLESLGVRKDEGGRLVKRRCGGAAVRQPVLPVMGAQRLEAAFAQRIAGGVVLVHGLLLAASLNRAQRVSVFAPAVKKPLAAVD